MVLWAASRPLRLNVVLHAAEGGNVSRRRSQRLNQQGRTRQQGRSLEEQMREREARAAEQQRLPQEDEFGLLPLLEKEEEQQGEGEEEQGPSSEERAMRNLVEQLQQWPPKEQEQEQEQEEPAEGGHAGDAAASSAAAAEPAVVETAGSEAAGLESEEEFADLPPIEQVEADFVLEEGQPAQPSAAPTDTPPRAPSRQAVALLAIMQSGDAVEEVIAQHRDDIDDKMLRLLERRIEAAQQLEPEAQEDVLEGLQLLHRRLKAEIDRQQAPPSLRLLDELLNILDPAGSGLTPTTAEREERRRQAAVRLRAAFAGGMTAEADVLTLASQLSSSGGAQLADQLMADPMDPASFMSDCTELLTAAQEQQRQVADYLQQLAEAPSGEDEEAAGRAAAQRAHLEGLLQERQAAAALVEEVLELALTVSRRLSGL